MLLCGHLPPPRRRANKNQPNHNNKPTQQHTKKNQNQKVAHDGRLITVFSAPNYCDQMGTKGAFIRFNGDDMVPHFTTFDAAPHPDVKPMAYANNFLYGGM